MLRNLGKKDKGRAACRLKQHTAAGHELCLVLT